MNRQCVGGYEVKPLQRYAISTAADLIIYFCVSDYFFLNMINEDNGFFVVNKEPYSNCLVRLILLPVVAFYRSTMAK